MGVAWSSGERDNARTFPAARTPQARKTSHILDGQHQDVDRTHHGRVNQNGEVHGVANSRIEDV